MYNLNFKVEICKVKRDRYINLSSSITIGKMVYHVFAIIYATSSSIFFTRTNFYFDDAIMGIKFFT